MPVRSVSDVDICNIALSHLGDQEITRLDDAAADENPIVRYCQDYYDTARQAVLETFEWSFAMSSQALSRRSNVATPGYIYAQVLPEDCLSLHTLHPGCLDAETETYKFSGRKIDKFRLMGRDVWTDAQIVSAVYTKDEQNPTIWSSHFRLAVARLLASFLAGPLTDNPSESIRQKELYETIDLPNAQYHDAKQDRSGENSDITTSRDRSPFLGTRTSSQGYYSDGSPID